MSYGRKLVFLALIVPIFVAGFVLGLLVSVEYKSRNLTEKTRDSSSAVLGTVLELRAVSYTHLTLPTN